MGKNITVSRSLSRYELETVINFNKEEKEASIFTYEVSWQAHLERLGFKPTMDNGFGGKEYMIPKSMIKKPRGKKVISEAQKEAGRIRLQKYRLAQKGTVHVAENTTKNKDVGKRSGRGGEDQKR